MFIVCGEFFSAFLIFWRCFNISAKDLNINEKIRAPKVRLIDSEGNQLGIVNTAEALEMAYDKGLDLVEMSGKSDPPVCKIIDYGKYRFERDKKEKESRKKQATVEIKEVKFSCKIGDHDFDTKIRHAVKFLQSGNKVKASLRFAGREMQHTELGVEVLGRVAAACEEFGTVEKQPKQEGRILTMFIAPKAK